MQPDGRWFKISYGKTKNLQSGWVRIDDIMESPSFPMGQMLNLYTKNN